MFPVIDIKEWERSAEEPMGGKTKEWREAPDGRRWLFKQVQRTTPSAAGPVLVGEDWAEKVVSELAIAAGLQVAKVELASDGDRRGCLVLSVLEDDEELVHGNELLFRNSASYPRDENYGPWYTVESAHAALASLFPESGDGNVRMLQSFSTYLVLDAWVANTDRHHENWGTIFRAGRSSRLSPSFDHASSLGFNLTDQKRLAHLRTKDRNASVEAWAARGKTPFYIDDVRQTMLEAARTSCELSEIELASMPMRFPSTERVREIIDSVPSQRMSSLSKEFAVRLLNANMQKLQDWGMQ